MCSFVQVHVVTTCICPIKILVYPSVVKFELRSCSWNMPYPWSFDCTGRGKVHVVVFCIPSRESCYSISVQFTLSSVMSVWYLVQCWFQYGIIIELLKYTSFLNDSSQPAYPLPAYLLSLTKMHTSSLIYQISLSVDTVQVNISCWYFLLLIGLLLLLLA